MKKRIWFVALTMFTLLTVTESFSQERPLFIGRREFRAGEGPVAIATGQFRGPSFPLDLAVVSAFTDDLSIFFGDGHGGFSLAGVYTGFNSPFHVIARDFNNDGVLDLAVANIFGFPPFVSVLLGNPANPGTFFAPLHYTVADVNAAVAAGDFDGDGYLDLAVAAIGPFDGSITGCDRPCTANNTISVLLNNRDGTFREARNFAVGCGPEGIAAEDLDGDGNADIATANLFSCNASVLFGDGTGNFLPHSDLPTAERSSTMLIADFNNNGNFDLATINEMNPSTVSVLLGDGAGGFDPATNCGIPGGVRIAEADLDGDGNVDVVVAGGSFDKIFVLLGDGRGSFVGCPISNTTPPAFDSGPVTVHLTIGDFNGDGIPDVATANKGAVFPPAIGNVSILTGDGVGNFGNFFALESDPIHVAVGDFNGDAYLDLAIANPNDDTVSVLLGDGFGGFSAPETYAVERRPVSIAIADFNNDGKLDLAVANFGSDSVSVLLGNGDGSFQPALSSDVEASLPNSLVVADFDCDGNEDLAIANPGSNNVRILYGDGTGGFARSRTLSTDDMIEPLSVVKADFNGDNRWDVGVVNRSSNNVSIFLADGCSPDSGFIARPNVPLSPSASPSFINAADFNRDGKSDIVVANTGLNNVSVFINNGDGTFGSPNNLPVGVQPLSVTIGDYDGDGNLDFAVANIGSDNVSVFLGLGNGSFRPANGSPFYAGSGPISIATGNFDNATGDTRPDLVTVTGGSNVVSVLFNNRP